MEQLYYYLLAWLLLWDPTEQQMLGPAKIVYKTFEGCEEPVSEVLFSVQQKRFNRTVSLMDIELSTPYDIDDSVKIELNSSMWRDGGWKPSNFFLKGEACETLKLFLGELFNDILRAGGKDDCPLPAGNYSALDYYLDNDSFNVPQIFGEYKMYIYGFHSDHIVMCNLIYFDFIPKTGSININPFG